MKVHLKGKNKLIRGTGRCLNSIELDGGVWLRYLQLQYYLDVHKLLKQGKCCIKILVKIILFPQFWGWMMLKWYCQFGQCIDTSHHVNQRHEC